MWCGNCTYPIYCDSSGCEINTLNYCPLKQITSDRGNGQAAEIKKGFKVGRSGGEKVAPSFCYFQTAVLKCVLLFHNWKFKIPVLILACFDLIARYTQPVF